MVAVVERPDAHRHALADSGLLVSCASVALGADPPRPDTNFSPEADKPYHLRVKRDAHVGTGLSKPFQLNWPRHARRMARRYHPRASVVFIGANDGFPLRYHGKRRDCCSR